MSFSSKLKLLSDGLIYRSARGGRPPWETYGLAVGLQVVLFLLSWSLQGESEALFAPLYVLSAIFTGFLLGAGPGHLAGVLAVISVDYHYLHPIGRILSSWQVFAFLLLTGLSVQIAISAVHILQESVAAFNRERKKAEEAVHAREKILSVVAHDLRQPLAAIGMKAELILRTGKAVLTPKHTKLLGDLQADVGRINKMIGDLLDLARIDSLQLKVQPQNTELKQLSQEMIAEFLTVRPELKLLLRCEEPLTVWADTDRVKQILSNLVSNAVKYGTEGTEIDVSIVHHGGEALITVTNSGPGIAEDQLKTIFERFVRAKDARSGRASGLGLGLYIAKNLVEAHGGRIWVESQPGLTSFHFTLPTASTAKPGIAPGGLSSPNPQEKSSS